MHIGFISMEPNSLFLPQYLDSDLVLFVHHGEARVGHIYKDELAERSLKHGDVYIIPAGSAFYLENTVKNQRLHIICSIDIASESMGWHAFQWKELNQDYVKLQVSTAELTTFLTRQSSRPIVHLSGSHHTNIWTKFVAQEPHKKLTHLKRIMNFGEEASPKEEESKCIWSLRKFMFNLLNRKDVVKRVNHKSPSTYNLYNRKPDFKNNYGWSKKLDESDYSPLQQSGNGVYLVNLSPGSMVAPHVNPTAIEYGLVLKGTGGIQIVYPNGTLAMNARV
ncbi:vicilin-like seed storage protein At2g28490 [Lycium ferocissimum]|uniref:vicilin-like seed storage protein At2g28490 n=1 Tax=Lycium ferocissimum TaxID=112874 RepID=UPI0028156014|nr:vicilin-like seed storage protein At2g28490 [Lycium ferocissimum]